jgi:hypothetical protein
MATEVQGNHDQRRVGFANEDGHPFPVAVLLVAGAVAQNAAGVVHLDLAKGPAAITDLEIPD